MNRIDRLTGTILLLQSHRSLTAADIAAHWEISVRTVYRDVAALGEAGVPIAGEAGSGYRLMRGYQVPPIMFAPDEVAALFLSAEVAGQVADESFKHSLRAAMLKIRSVLPEERRNYLAGFRQSVAVRLTPNGGSPTGPESATEGLMPIQDAILRRRCLTLRYDTAGEGRVTSRVVEPLGILFYSGRWHLIAFCRLRADFRDFRLDRIRNCEMLDDVYQGHADFSVRSFLEKAIESMELTPATVRVRKPFVERFRAEFFCTPVREQALVDGCVRFEILVFSIPWFAEWLLRFGAGILVEEPPELRRLVKEAADQVAALHRETISEKIETC